MKKAQLLSAIGIIAMIATFSGCSSESSDSSTAKLSLTSETSRQQTTQLHSDIDYNLDKEYKIGDLRFNASSTWECVSESDELIYFKINDIDLFVNCSDYMSSIMTDEEVFETHMGSNYSDVDYVKVADNNAVIFSKPDDYSRNVVTVHNNKSYWLYAKGLTDEKNDCNKIISEVFNTINLPTKTALETTISSTASTTKEQTQKTNDIEQLLFKGNGVEIYFTGQSERESFLYDGYDKLINLRIENNSDYDYTIQGRDESINGYMITGILSCDVTSKKKANTDIIFEYKDLSKNGISEIKTVELYFSIFNSKDSSHDFKTEKIVFNP